MNALVKKEIRLLLPGWSVAMLLALVQAVTRPYDFYIVCLMFIGLTIMALTSIGREASLNTFSFMLAQPAERMRIWQTKLSVLAIAFLTVLASWLVCFFIAGSHGFATNHYGDYNLFITICLIATATFTGGLWTTLLLRQIAGAFWLTLLVPAVLSGFSAGFLSQSESNSAVIAGLCVVFAIYSVGGFLFARRLFFRAQDAGWSGGVIPLPEWNFFTARAGSAVSTRSRKPVIALLKKEVQLQQASLAGAVGLLALHLGVIALRKYHPSAKESVSEIVTCMFWMLWLVIPVVIGNMAVAEERRLGVMEGQLCQPASRRIQFAIKGFAVLFLGILLGVVMPLLLEVSGELLGAPNPAVTADGHTFGSPFFPLGLVIYSTVMALVSFFASSLAKNFLQAVGYTVATFIGLAMIIAALADKQIRYYSGGLFPGQSILPLLIAVPTITITLLWLACLNYKNFQPGWPLWRRNLLGFAGAFVFVIVTSLALYHRVWEVFEPVEPAHGPAKFSLASPPRLRTEHYDNLLVRLPDGRVWFDYLNTRDYDPDANRIKWLVRYVVDPLPKSAGAQRFVAGSNWLSATARHVDFLRNYKDRSPQTNSHIVGYLDTVGVKTDGTLWISDVSSRGAWTGDQMHRVGEGTNWQQVVRAQNEILLLKQDGTLWGWGTNRFDWSSWPTNWPSLHTFPLHQIGADSDWREIFSRWGNVARKADGRVWRVGVNDKSGESELRRETNLDRVVFQTLSFSGNGETAFVRPEGTLWMSWMFQTNGKSVYSDFVQVGTETNWTAVALNQQSMVALKSDGSLWQWRLINPWNGNSPEQLILAAQKPPTRLGIHKDWVAMVNTWDAVIALAADGSLWLWPNREEYEQYTLLKLSKQPQLLGNVFGKAD
jgi:hypothetical protein